MESENRESGIVPQIQIEAVEEPKIQELLEDESGDTSEVLEETKEP